MTVHSFRGASASSGYSLPRPQALEIVDTFTRSGAVDVIVVDSVAALVPRAEIEGDMGDHHMALQARLMSQAMRKITASLSRSRGSIFKYHKNPTLIIFLVLSEVATPSATLFVHF